MLRTISLMFEARSYLSKMGFDEN